LQQDRAIETLAAKFGREASFLTEALRSIDDHAIDRGFPLVEIGHRRARHDGDVGMGKDLAHRAHRG
jgi:hypothetical protein